MDKNAIKSFAIESRRQMIESVKYQASLIGITAEGISEPISKAEGMETYDYGIGTHSIYDEDIQKRKSLVKEIENKGFDNVVEEVAYTWFNRIIAIRFMEVNDYLPTRTRVLSSEIEGKREPDIITDALDLDLDFNQDDKKTILKFKDENKLDELFKFLFIKQCNKLNDILPGLFEKTNDYLELLLEISFTKPEGIVRRLIDSILEDDFKNQVEIIGWLYQFYNVELKDETFKNISKNKVSKEKLPAVTQLFTPDWIVRYMVENSLGRLWIENHSNNNLKLKWNYYLDEAQQESDVSLQLNEIRNRFRISSPEDIKVIDPCMGSGHILVYVFDVLMQIYVSEGFMEKDAAISIIKNNLYGLDIDDRAYQLAYFAIMMKSRSYNRNIFNYNLNPMIGSIQESNHLSSEFLDLIISENYEIKDDLTYLIEIFNDAKLYGSLLKIKKIDFNRIFNVISTLKDDNHSTLNLYKYSEELELLQSIVFQAKLLYSKYDVIVTNPPYMGIRNMNKQLSNFLNKNYAKTKFDLSTAMMERSISFSNEYSFISMINIPVWMFLYTYEDLRGKLLDNLTLINMLHMGRGVFGADFGSTSFVINAYFVKNYRATYRQLFEDKGSIDSIKQKEEWFFKEDKNWNKFLFNQNDFNEIPGSPIAYWTSKEYMDVFKRSKYLQDICDVKAGIGTSDNNRFLRFWHEINFKKFGLNFKSRQESKESGLKWFPYNKGGEFRKWYGNHIYVINWENDGEELRNFKKSTLRNPSFYFKKSISWSLINSSYFGARFFPYGFLFDVNGSSLFSDDEYYYYIGGFLCSKLSTLFLSILNPTIAFQVGNIKTLPFIFDINQVNIVEEIVKENINLSKIDWNNYETSWNYLKHPLLMFDAPNIKKSFELWSDYKNNLFTKVKMNEIKLNSIFSEIYSINFDCNVEDEDVTIRKPNYEMDIKSFISYAVGCMFGRYSLDNEGIQFAGGNFDLSNYSKCVPDDDNIIPVLDTEYFEDDIVGRFVEFVKVCFGEESLEENLDFIAGALNKKGKTSREIIRNYFLKDFFKEHSKIYNKCPIYWQFDSGKQNAFKCLIYMHRYEPGLVARVRTDYLHKTQKAIEQNVSHCDSIISSSSNKSDISKATKDKSKYIKQLDEIKVYDEALRHMATQNIEIDLDDGVKVNYSKFQNVEVSQEGEKTKKINLLKKV